MQGSPLNSYNVSTSFNQPTKSYLPNPSQSVNDSLVSQNAGNNFAQGDMRSLFFGSPISQSNRGVSTDYKSEPGIMQDMLSPRSQYASQTQQSLSAMPYGFQNQNYDALLGLQGANAQQALGIGNIAQQLGQAGQSYQLGQYGGNLNLFQNLMGGLFGGIGGLIGNTMSGLGGGSGSSSLGSGLGVSPEQYGFGGDTIGIPGLTTG